MRQRVFAAVPLVAVLWSFIIYSGMASFQANSAFAASAATEPYVGRWDLSIKTPTQVLPSWIEVSEEHGRLKVVMVGVDRHAIRLANAEIKNGEIGFLSPRLEEGFSDEILFKGKRVGDELVGTTSSPNGVSWNWTGRRVPALARKATPKWGKPVTLFNGKDLAGWSFADFRRGGVWTVRDGTLVKDGHGGYGADLVTASQFEDFKLHLEFESGPESNSGVFLRGRYEVQIETDSAAEPPSHHTSGVYGFIAPMPELPRRVGQWQNLDITLVGRIITVVQNSQTVIDHQEIPGITGLALDSHEELPGPIYLQGSEKGRVAFRNIVITPAE